MKTIGIIGGGQLGFYLGLTAHRMGFNPIFLDSNKLSPARYISNNFICADFNDEEAVEKLVNCSDIVTYEFENVDLEVIKKLNKSNKFPQGHTPLEISNDRLVEKNTAKKLGINTPRFMAIDTKEQLQEAIKEIPEGILKTRRFGYDGKGQYSINSEEDIKKIPYGLSFILEEKIKFDYELSIIGIRSTTGEVKLYKPVRNVHKDGILYLTYTDTGITEELENKCYEVINKFLVEKNIYGILCCELFVCGDEVYFNELAPRPHNSGHITMDTHITSQYENHIRAILGLPLGSTEIKQHGVMLNILGESYDKLIGFYDDNCIVYDYKKGEPKPKRKMGHINYIGSDVQVFEEKIKELF